MTLKEKLLATHAFRNNIFLQQYCELVETNRTTLKQKGVTQQHHIIPRKYYQLADLPVDNTRENKVHLTYRDHILAHYYLALCCESQDLRVGMMQATLTMISTKSQTYQRIPPIEELLPHLDLYQRLHEELTSHIAERTKRIHTGRKRSEETRLKISKALTGKVISEESRRRMSEAKRGRKLSEEQRLQISLRMKGKPKSWAGRKQSPQEIESRRQKLIGHVVSEETRLKISQKLKEIGHQPPAWAIQKSKEARAGKPAWNRGLPGNTHGRICLYRPENDQELKYVLPEELEIYLSQGWQQGNPGVAKHRKVQGSTNSRAVRCIETGQEFDSVKAATKWCQGSVANVLNGISKTAGGYHWERVSPPSSTFGQPKQKRLM